MIATNKAAIAAFVAGVVVAGGGIATAAGAKSLLLGESNKVAGTTALKNTASGPVLKLTGPRGAAPLAVNGHGRVANLNADRLDGVDSKALALRAGRTGTASGTGTNVDVDNDGINDLFVALALCPAGTIVTGGGFENFTPAGEYFAEVTPDNDGWWVATDYDAANSPEDLVATVQCYNPRGAVSTSALRPSTAGQFSKAQRAKLADTAARSR